MTGMGFQPIDPAEPIRARFTCLHVFEVRGFTIASEEVITRKCSVAGVEFMIAVAASINSACMVLVNDAYVDDEEKWSKEHKCSSPYVALLFGPTNEHSASTGMVSTKGEGLVTYNAFRDARTELSELRDRALPSFEMAFSCAFGSREPPVELVRAHHTVVGTTSAGEKLTDFHLEGQGTAYVSTSIEEADLKLAIEEAGNLASSLDTRVSRFFSLASREDDELKKFLYFFLALEIETHRAFKSVPISDHLGNAATHDARTANAVIQLLEARENWKSLADRFVWCVVSAWPHMDSDDVAEFKRLKKIRNDIAHGRIAIPDASDVRAVEVLAKRVHSAPPISPDLFGMTDLTPGELQREIEVAEQQLREVDIRAFRLWERVRIKPVRWSQPEYPDIESVWVIGLLGRRCLCYNPVESGWGWGEYADHGAITRFHWQQDEIHHSIYQALHAIDHGGRG